MARRSTFERTFMSRLTLSTTTKAEIISRLENDTDVLHALRSQRTPVARVTARELVPAHGGALARGTMARSEGVYRDLLTVDLYDLRDVDRVDVIRIGRHPENDIQILDLIVSREHGLVLYDGHTFYYDYGTYIEPGSADRRPPGRSGSLNGSFLNGELLIQNGLVPWMHDDTIRLGTQFPAGYAIELAYVETRARPAV